ncbi:MAG: DNA polymerase III subunit beta, partial [Lentisphaeria bacterium]|nr:DNA polymerase III subunit beta [Lentisphaeria bacterium]
MKLTVSKENFTLGLRRVLAVVSPRTTLPVLNNVLIECDGESVVLSTTDLEVAVTATVPALVEEAGATTLPAKKLSQIVSSLPDGDITLESGQDLQTKISCGRSEFKVLGLDPNEYPKDSDFHEEWQLSMTADELRKSFSKVSYGRSSDEARYVLNGILMSVRNSVLTVAATDGRRLALIERALSEEGIADGDVILPSKVVAEIERSFGGDKKITVKLSDSRAVFDGGDIVIVTKLVEGTYPNYRQVVPAEFSHSVAIPRSEFSEVLNRVSTVVSSSSSSVTLTLNNAVMVISASSTEFGESSEPMDVSYEGDKFELAFNPVFFADPLRHLECDHLGMQFNDEF